MIRISPARPLRDKLEVFDGNQLLASRELSLKPMQPVEESRAARLRRPRRSVFALEGTSSNTPPGMAMSSAGLPPRRPASIGTPSTAFTSKAKKRPASATTRRPRRHSSRASKQDTNYLPALVELAALANRRADSAAALGFARHALSIDTYDPGANYQFGLASAALGHQADAKDAFSLAALSPGWRSAADTELAKELSPREAL